MSQPQPEILHAFFELPPTHTGVILPLIASTTELALALAAHPYNLQLVAATKVIDGKSWDGYTDQNGKFYVLRRIAGEGDMAAALHEIGLTSILALGQ